MHDMSVFVSSADQLKRNSDKGSQLTCDVIVIVSAPSSFSQPVESSCAAISPCSFT
jgi:hypothetical protein